MYLIIYLYLIFFFFFFLLSNINFILQYLFLHTIQLARKKINYFKNQTDSNNFLFFLKKVTWVVDTHNITFLILKRLLNDNYAPVLDGAH